MNETEPQSYQEFESLPARVAGVIRSPRAVFTRVISRPRSISVIAACLAVTLVCGVGFMQTDVGRQALVDQWERTALAFGQEVDDARYAEFQRLGDHAPAYAAVSAIASGPVLTLIVAVVIFGLFSGALHGTARFGQVLAVVAHAGVILALRQVVAAPLNYSRETLASPTTLGLFFPMFDEASPAARFFGAIDLFVVWWVVLLALGVALLYRRPTRSTAFAFMGAYVGLAVLLAIAMAVSGGTV
jgi:hypothetical protein